MAGLYYHDYIVTIDCWFSGTGGAKGDQKIKEISAASIIAKVSRDKLMNKMSKKFKKYKWDLNAGYGTKDHIKAIKKYGITKFHRKTFKPVHKMLSLKKS